MAPYINLIVKVDDFNTALVTIVKIGDFFNLFIVKKFVIDVTKI